MDSEPILHGVNSCAFIKFTHRHVLSEKSSDRPTQVVCTAYCTCLKFFPVESVTIIIVMFITDQGIVAFFRLRYHCHIRQVNAALYDNEACSKNKKTPQNHWRCKSFSKARIVLKQLFLHQFLSGCTAVQFHPV